MAVGKLNVNPVTVRGLPSSGLQDARLFVGCFIQENEKHRTHAESGPEPFWKNPLTCTVAEGQNFLHVELVNENPNNGGIVATSKLALNQVFDQGTETKWVQLNSPSGQSFGELKLELSFNGTNSVSSVSSSFGNMNLAGGQQVSYQQTSTHSQTTSHSQSDSRQGSFASLGPANPIPSNYGSGTPPPFTPQAAVSYPGKDGNNTMPGMPAAGGLVAGEHGRPPIRTEDMTKSEFETAKEKGAIPSWMKYGGGILAGAAAVGLTAWGAHEAKEYYDERKEEEERLQKQSHKDDKPFVPPAGYLQQEGSHQQQQQHQQQPQAGGEQHKQYPQPPQQQQHPIQICPQPPQYRNDEHKSSEHKKEKKEKKDKKDKHHKKHGSDSDSSSSDSDSSDDERKSKKDKHGKKKDSEWR